MTEEHEEDQDSLFGSPPPSPRIPPQRPSSPALSLPSASICDSERRLSTSTDLQNVGTIALPGSHPFSELPINPLALSLNHTTVHRPPAGQPVPTTAKQKIQSWQPPPAQIKSKGSKKSRQSSQSPVSDVPSRDPEFSLPDPSAPPPAHFLRNQQNLLGKAGLVAGVKPSTITHIRGATSSNPIVIDDEDTPLLGRRSQSGESRHHYVNPGLLTAPTNEDIVSVLIGQKDIFPVLKGILGLIGKGATRRTPTASLQSRHSSSKHPPVKRRKLNRVPAGATDWDVPYPFQEGEGPDEYHKTWERERTKHLVAQLVKLIKMAARKAATKNYLARQAAWEKLQQEMMESEPIVKKDMTVNNHYKPQTIAYGLSGTQAQKAMSQVFDVLTDTSNDQRAWPPESSATATQHSFSSLTNQNEPAPPSQVSLDSLISSLVAATPNQDAAAVSTLTNSQNRNTSTPVDGSSTASDDQSLFNTWMTFLQAFPVAFDSQSQPQSSLASSQASTPGLDDFSFINTMANNFDFGANTEGSSPTSNIAAGRDDLDALISSMLDSLPQDMESTPIPTSSSSSQPSLIGDDAIDPSLLALSVQPTSEGMNEIFSMSQAVSPVPSMSSSGGAGPMTPMLSAWEPDIFMGVNGDGGQGVFRHTLWDNFSQAAYRGCTEGGGWDEVGQITRDFLTEEGNMTPVVGEGEGKGKGKEVLRTNPLGFLSADATTPTQSVYNTLVGTQSTDIALPPYEQQEHQTPTPETRPPPPRPKNTISQSRKEEILRRAREKKKQVQEELDGVKTRLWETTIEQAALVHLLKRFENNRDDNLVVG